MRQRKFAKKTVASKIVDAEDGTKNKVKIKGKVRLNSLKREQPRASWCGATQKRVSPSSPWCDGVACNLAGLVGRTVECAER